MPLALRLWRAPNGFTRVYLNGLPMAGKAWLQGSRGRTTVHFEAGSPGMGEDEVMSMVALAVRCDPGLWADLVSELESAPRGGRSARGRKPGTMASSRRAVHAPPPEAWTALHAAELDPNDMLHPLEMEHVVVVDDREPAAMVDMLRAVRNLKVEVASLETGDYVVPGVLVIERKTAADLAQSVMGDAKRLFGQTDRVASSGMAGVLLVEGDLYRQTNMSLPSLTGTLSYLAVIQGIAVLPTLSPEHSAYMIAKLVRHATEGLGYELALRGSGPKDPVQAASFVLEGIPGVSAVTARALIAAFGSVAGVAAATRDELRSVPGVGERRAGQIFETLRAGPPEGE